MFFSTWHTYMWYSNKMMKYISAYDFWGFRTKWPMILRPVGHMSYNIWFQSETLRKDFTGNIFAENMLGNRYPGYMSTVLYNIESLLSLDCRNATKTEHPRDSRYDTIKTPYARPKATLPNCTPSPAMARTWTESSLTRCKSNKNQPNTLTLSQFPVFC